MQPAKLAKTTKPRVRDAKATRERILSMAYKEFAVRGYDGARIDAIVARCKISKNLLYHYFSGKEALFIEVMERAYGAMRERQNELALPGEDPIADMRTLVIQTVQHFIDQPEFIQLLSTENLYKAKHIKKSQKITAMFNPLKSALDNILEKGKHKGVFRQDVDWIDLYISISGLGAYCISNRHTLSYVLGTDLGTPERTASRLKHIPDMVLSYLCDLGTRTANGAAAKPS
ncbi:TetR family transcriptional regulator [Paralcaligenes ureilyticus]|uniref:TetR family transcriptional regulator n=2 Tax=Paralcaligenes ureilyticus TaxID=627131 RepID=A0A4R3MEA0_9BURK|nr:TetR family transcriptional regulator [Paralcaligenes ureilyticus]